jgi:hypothetical protein
LSIKTKLIGGASALVMAGGMLAFAAPAANAAVTTMGTCNNLLALGSAKSSTVGLGITDQDNLSGALSTKGVGFPSKTDPLGTCTTTANQGAPDSGKPVGLLAGGSHTVTKWGTKLFSREFDCNTTDVTDNSEWSPSGALSITFADTVLVNGIPKPNSLTAQVTVDGFTDPDNNPATPSDVVAFHGIVIKGDLLGSDVAGETEFDPIVKDTTQKTNPGPYNGNVQPPYYGYQYDLANGLGCQDATPNNANILLFMNGSVGGHSQLLLTPLSGITFTKGTA